MTNIGASFGVLIRQFFSTIHLCGYKSLAIFYFICKLFISYSCTVGLVAEYKLLKQKKKQKTFKKISLCHSK